MKPTILIVVWLIGILTLFADSTNSPSANVPKTKIRVKIDITAQGMLDGQIRSYMRREFDKIDDVEIVEDNPFITIQCVSVPISNKVSDGPAGYALSFAVTDNRNKLVIMVLAADGKLNLTDDQNKLWSNTMKDMTSLTNHFLLISAPHDLETNCRNAVSKIDGEDIEDARQLFNGLQDMQSTTGSQ